MAEKRPKNGWLARRREKQRLKRERTADSPEKLAERKRGAEPTVEDAAKRTGIGGVVGGWF